MNQASRFTFRLPMLFSYSFRLSLTELTKSLAAPSFPERTGRASATSWLNSLYTSLKLSGLAAGRSKKKIFPTAYEFPELALRTCSLHYREHLQASVAGT